MKIGITYNLKDEISKKGNPADTESVEEFDTIHTIDAICAVLEKNGFETAKLGGSIGIVEKIKDQNLDFVFNIAEGYHGRNRESHIPAILEMLAIPYSGSDPLTLGITLDKIMIKKIAAQAGIPVPRYAALERIEEVDSIHEKKVELSRLKGRSSLPEAEITGLKPRGFLRRGLKYPLITKPAWEGSSKGIYNSSKVNDKESLKKNIVSLLEKYPGQPVLVEEYIKGKEVTVGVIGNNPPQILGLMEIINKVKPGEDFFYSMDVKRDWRNLVDYRVPAEVSKEIESKLRRYALLAFKGFGARDICRIDFRISEKEEVFLLELNPLPGLSPEYADLVIMSRKCGIEFDELVMRILKMAFERYGISYKKEKTVKSGL